MLLVRYYLVFPHLHLGYIPEQVESGVLELFYVPWCNIACSLGRKTFCPNTQRNILGILLNKPEIRFYLPFSDFGLIQHDSENISLCEKCDPYLDGFHSTTPSAMEQQRRGETIASNEMYLLKQHLITI